MKSISNRKGVVKTGVLGLAVAALFAGGCASSTPRSLPVAGGSSRVSANRSLAASDGLGRQIFAANQSSTVALFRSHQASQAIALAERNELVRIAKLQEDKQNQTTGIDSAMATVPVPND